jgi:signal transduction histidine kinase
VYLWLAFAAGVVTVLPYVLPGGDVAYRSPALHVALETAAALVALLVAYLVLQRFRLRAGVTSLLLFSAFVLLSITNLFFAAIPSALPSLSTERFATWATLAGSFLGAAFFAGAAFAPNVRVRRPHRALGVTLAGCLLALLSVAAIVLVLGSRLPLGIDPAHAPTAPDAPRLTGSPVLLAAQLVIMLFFVAAFVGFAHRGLRRGDQLMKWIAAAAVFGAFARLNYFLFPSLYTDWVYTGDGFRLLFYAVLLVGAALEIHGYQRGLARAVVVEERRRLARELHDGLAQELAFITMQGSSLAAKGAAEEMEPILSAAKRALTESRTAISTLTRPIEAPIEQAIAGEAWALTARTDARLELALASGVEISPESREAALRIVREAMINAIKHGNASALRVELEDGPQLRLRVIDDGIGFDRDGETPRGFGLRSMRERAEMLGGSLRIESRPGAGTIVEVALP